MPLAAASWSFAPGAIVTLAAAEYVYVRRWRQSRSGREPHPPSVGRLLLFTAGILTVFAALVSPIDTLADDLLVMHMVQHLLLLDIAPILCILGLTKVLLRPVTRRVQVVERKLGPLATPAAALILYVGVMWVWHIPALYDTATEHSGVHVLEHISFALAGGLYWWHLIAPIRTRQRLSGMGPVVYMLASKLGVGLLAIGLTFAPNPIYPHYENVPQMWGLTPSTDQALAGVVMGVEQSILMGIVLAWLFTRMLGESEDEALRQERFETSEAV
jgi:putative membrane protein